MAATPDYYLRRVESQLLNCTPLTSSILWVALPIVELGAGTSKQRGSYWRQYAKRWNALDLFFPRSMSTPNSVEFPAQELVSTFPLLFVFMPGSDVSQWTGVRCRPAPGQSIFHGFWHSHWNMEGWRLHDCCRNCRHRPTGEINFFARWPIVHVRPSSDRHTTISAGYGPRRLSIGVYCSIISTSVTGNFVTRYNFRYRSKYEFAHEENESSSRALLTIAGDVSRSAHHQCHSAHQSGSMPGVMWKFRSEDSVSIGTAQAFQWSHRWIEPVLPVLALLLRHSDMRCPLKNHSSHLRAGQPRRWCCG